MKYKTVLEMSQRWNVNIRTVQKWANSGKLDGACKIGRDWMIPEDTEFPLTKGTVNPTNPYKNAAELSVMPLMNGSFVLGKAISYINTLDTVECRSAALAEYYYFCGNAQKASDECIPLLSSKEQSIRLSALLVHSFANIALGNIDTVQQDFTQIQACEKHKSNPKEAVISVFVASMTAILLHKPEELPSPLDDFIKYLPDGMKLYSFYALAHLCYLKGDYNRSIGIAETGLTMMESPYPIPLIYLNLITAIDYMNLQQVELGKSYFNTAWTLAQQDGFLQPFAEHHGLLGGLVEIMLKDQWKDACKKIIEITYSFSRGWQKVHNQNAPTPITDELTTTEFGIAMMASKKWSNRQIAKCMQCSESTIKTHLASIYRKLGINDRSGLKQFLLK